ncbi:peptide chain release factor N(5)-glutamine methyltransferase [Methylocystis sp. WRRC1]|uniref:peptide chain release factor N(5)-glutamine methyltransferase n=1 Tax=Methylocystis sp. WRRC1 TaxID=1732014 RepID=UPI001D15485D|nr:peptide chain release factor N(5)-glutamine methyltransferase [Methylocystis sp. WRRC1]MCC3244607.1 peptide chain release factor N(5)-glutamine methyltransferase [Methylocystis sp. WRRC1]
MTTSEAREETPTRAEAIAQVAKFLVAGGVEEAQAHDDARALLRAAADLSRLELAMRPQAPLAEEHADALSHYAARRAAREPVSRILGERGFWTLDLLVAPDVLDPRPDTETLIETTLDLIGEKRNEPLSILDLGTGSGAIVCALLSELPRARAVAVDLSPQACAAAANNLARCGFSNRASVMRGRWAEALSARFDIIVSNPPYVRAGEIPQLDPEVRLHDPALALDGGVDGLDCYREIIDDLPRLVADDGLVAFEVGSDQAVSVASLLGAQGFGVERVGRDLGGHERVVAARRARSRS